MTPTVPAPVAGAVARSAGWLSRRTGRGGGTTVPGVVLLKLRPTAVTEMAQSLTRSVAISATNGKTTTARLVAAAVERSGATVVANTAGSNLLRGVAAALLDAGADATGAIGVFEVDEAAMPAAVSQVEPDVVVLMNLFRDQLDRYGELDHLADLWAEMVGNLPPSTVVVANADDPTIASLVADRSGSILFGLDDTSLARDKLQHATDSTTCRSCGADLEHDVVFIGHMGHWRCTNCARARSTPHVTGREVELHGLSGSTVTVDTPAGSADISLALPGVHNVYNAIAATAAAHAMGVNLVTTSAAIAATDAAFGRAERVMIDDHELTVLLAKNPAGVNENLRTLLLHPEPVHALIQLNDRTADGRDVSWIWDVDFEVVFDHLASVTLCGDRGYDMALRFRYGGYPVDQLSVHATSAAGLDAALAKLPDSAPLFALPTYTSMLELREVLVERGVAKAFWKDD